MYTGGNGPAPLPNTYYWPNPYCECDICPKCGRPKRYKGWSGPYWCNNKVTNGYPLSVTNNLDGKTLTYTASAADLEN